MTNLWVTKNTEINIPISRNGEVWMRFDNRFKPMVLLMLLCSFLVMSTGAAEVKITIKDGVLIRYRGD